MGTSSGLESRSELGVGNVIFPLAYQVNQSLTVGATLKFMWSSLDMKMTASGAQLAGMAQASGIAPTGGLAMMLPGLAGAPWANISFSDDNAFTGAAKSTGFGASLGATYKVNQDVTIGASYQFKTALDDMKTAAAAASLSAVGGFVDNGQITVIDFQMPAVLALGASWQASPTLLFAADLKYIGWADAMKSFKMRYDSATPGFGSVNFVMQQDWKDQTALSLGLAWKVNDALTLRAGMNVADNPIPDTFVNPLFPATVKEHYTLGLGYKVSKADEFNMAVTMAPEVRVTNSSGMAPLDITHAQTNWQFMYSRHF
jgi:long-chain fatty acid transport protein